MTRVFLILVKFSSRLYIKAELIMEGIHHTISKFNFFYLLDDLSITSDPMLIEINRNLFIDFKGTGVGLW